MSNNSKKPEEESEKQKPISLLEKWQNQMNLIQEKTGIKGIYVIIFLILAVILVYFQLFESIITNLVGTAYPAFWTIKSIELNSANDQKKWLTYWVVFGSFILVDMFSVVIVKFVPFYFVLKILFLIWLFMPGSNGCTIIYYLLVKKIFRYYEDKIDSYADNAKKLANEYVFNEENFKKINSLKKKLNMKKNDVDAMAEARKLAQEMEQNEKKENNDHPHGE